MTLGLFQGFGIELEYAVVDAASCRVRPIVDELLRSFAGEVVGDFDDGVISWSNELALHVIELKTNGPAASLAGLAAEFQRSVGRLATALQPFGARLLPGGMHATMDPAREFRRWPHDYADVYAAYDRIFDCRGHGWSNLQSCHLNLPFANDDEFGRLHLACRALLPLLPALAASSPFVEGRNSGWRDWRLQVYRHNQARVPRIAGAVIPEPVTTREQYFREILEPIWADIAPFDPAGLLQEEWLNSRGAVAKFFRDALEIRVLDVQECPAADLAIAALVVAVLRALCAERWVSLAELASLSTAELAAELWQAAEHGEQAVLANAALRRALGLPAAAAPMQEAWQQLADAVLPDVAALDPLLREPLAVLLQQGSLASRMLRFCGSQPTPGRLLELQQQLAECLQHGVVFRS